MNLKHLCVVLVSSILSAPLSAGFYVNDMFYEGPLEPGCFDVEIRAGVNPIILSDRRPFFLVVSTPMPGEGRITPFFDDSTFLDMFNTPWIIAGQVNYNVSTNSQVFYELNYTRASGNTLEKSATVRGEQFDAILNVGSFGQFGAYLGHRFFFNPFWDDMMHAYFGHKIGLAHYRQVCATISRRAPTPTLNLVNQVVYNSQTVVSGGLHLGFDYCLADWVSFVLQAEVVASGALDNTVNRIIFDPVDTDLGASNVIVGKTGTVVGFPVSAGFSFSW